MSLGKINKINILLYTYYINGLGFNQGCILHKQYLKFKIID